MTPRFWFSLQVRKNICNMFKLRQISSSLIRNKMSQASWDTTLKYQQQAILWKSKCNILWDWPPWETLKDIFFKNKSCSNWYEKEPTLHTTIQSTFETMKFLQATHNIICSAWFHRTKQQFQGTLHSKQTF